MAQGLDSTKNAALPSHEAIEEGSTATEVGKSEQQKIDHTAMEMAKRADNRTKAYEDTAPDQQIFTK
jgi:uncharacterized protein YccT (UPF0319 family)